MAKANPHILITGGSGLIGRRLTDLLLSKGYSVSHLNRKPGRDKRVKNFTWDVARGLIDEQCIDGIDIIVHLAGAGIADKKWTTGRKKEIIDSRTESIRLIYKLMKDRPNKVNSFISATAIGYYGDRGDELLTEESAPGEGFMPECCIAWEKAVDEGKALGLRILKLRTGIVLDKRGGALLQMARPVKLFVGAGFGSGRQWVSWIHWEDAADMYLAAIENINLAGVYNMVAPAPVTNRQLMKAIAKQLNRPLWFFNVPSFVFKLLIGEMSIMVLGSANVSAQKILDDGFKFKYPELQSALRQIYG
ncbi:MAG: TIGR01777 family oxidoreductase [Bacteroidetes bacterium]|nr:TIGR01777 family oxidoreductase [Bacteroidota bacterium]